MTASLVMRVTANESIVEGTLEGADWLRAGLTVVAAIVFAIVAGRLVRRIMSRWSGRESAGLVTGRLASYLTFVVGFIYALTSLGVRVGPLLGALGLGGLVLALALQKPVENFFAGVILQARRPFAVGDTVSLGDHLGRVIDIDSRTTVLESLDGTTIRIPNARVADGDIVNLTRKPHRRSTLEVGVSYDTELDVATAALGIAILRVQAHLGGAFAAGATQGFRGIEHRLPHLLLACQRCSVRARGAP